MQRGGWLSWYKNTPQTFLLDLKWKYWTFPSNIVGATVTKTDVQHTASSLRSNHLQKNGLNIMIKAFLYSDVSERGQWSGVVFMGTQKSIGDQILTHIAAFLRNRMTICSLLFYLGSYYSPCFFAFPIRRVIFRSFSSSSTVPGGEWWERSELLPVLVLQCLEFSVGAANEAFYLIVSVF